MARKRSVPPQELGHRWFLAEWAELKGMSQAVAQRELGWPKSTTSNLFTGEQRYNQNYVEEAARWLGIEPYELLMPPREAEALRAFRMAARQVAAEDPERDRVTVKQ